MQGKHKKKQRGFTLIELMVTVAVFAILAAIAVPGFQNLIRDNRMTAQVNDMVTALHLARNEAIRRRTNASICPSANPSAASPTCITGNAWGTGWIVFMDPANIGTRATTEEILQVHGPLSGGNTLDWGAGFDYVSYQATGLGFPNGTFTFCDTRGATEATRIVIGPTGRPSVEHGAAACS